MNESLQKFQTLCILFMASCVSFYRKISALFAVLEPEIENNIYFVISLIADKLIKESF